MPSPQQQLLGNSVQLAQRHFVPGPNMWALVNLGFLALQSVSQSGNLTSKSQTDLVGFTLWIWEALTGRSASLSCGAWSVPGQLDSELAEGNHSVSRTKPFLMS